MPSVSDRSPSAFSSPSPGRSIFSRIASPFSSKSRNIADFSIEPDDPLKQHSPGDLVTGCVRLRVSRPIRVTHIVVCLHGFVQVYRNPGSPGEGFRANPAYLGVGRGKKSGEYFGNGFASLFEDEVVLCGDGRLGEGTYQFNFELEFPDCDLPSSIDFERGTITYMITATMTRPTTISPTISYDRKVYFVERIDVSPLYPPKPRTITLEPVSRRSRAKSQARKLVDPSDKKSRKTDSAEQGSDPPRQSEASSARSTRADSGTPVSPIPSEVSLESSSHGQTSQPDSQQQPSSEEGRGNASKSSLTSKVITATIESQAGGCLRGDSIPIKVHICHTKHVKSLYGVIVTLYRQARVDMHPSIPLGPTEKGKDAKYEDYYPKSTTGLGGLSLTGAGSSHIFRKDLSQIMAPLMIDPQSLEVEINTKVRVPEEAFPTISTVPGAMISFKYYVEVVLDIQGRLAGQDRSLTNLSGHAGLPGHTFNFEGSDMERSAFTPFGSTIVDTAPIRRDKSVVTSTFEVVIGTRDSERRKGKRKLMGAAPGPEPEAPNSETQQEPQQTPEATTGVDWYDPNAYYDPRWYDQEYMYWYPNDYSSPDHHQLAPQDQTYDQPPPLVPIPQIPDESQMTEKERIQQAEARLLPSQPPGIDAEQSDGSGAGATAPYLPEEDNVPGTWNTATSSSTAFPPQRNIDACDRQRQMSLAPAYEPPEAGSSADAITAPRDDKQEMERRHLRSEASAPPADNVDTGSSSAREHEPSAPTLAEANGTSQDIHDSHSDALGSSDLPQYER